MSRDTGPSRKTREAVYERAGHACEMCGQSRGPLAIHHRRPRAMGGTRREDTNSPANLLLLCDSDHRWVEANREKALARGYLVRQHDDPALVPVERFCVPTREECVDDVPCMSCPWRAA